MNLADAVVQQNPYSLAALVTLLAALGLSSAAGLRAYLPLFAVGLASSATNPIDNTSFIPLQSNFAALSSPPVLIILALLVIIEFAVDKLPIIDHLSDLVHTIIRPVSGAVIMAGTANTLSDHNQALAALLGGALAFAFHGVKATTRPAVSATTAGIGNPIVSLIEDILVLAAVAALIFLPVIGFVAVVALIIFMFRLIRRTLRRIRGKKAGQGVVVAASGGRGRGRGKKAAQAAALVPVGAPMLAGASPAPIANAGVVPAVAAPTSPPVPANPAAATPVRPAAPTSPTTPTAPTQAATNAAPPYVPSAPQPNPIQPPPGVPPAQTQAYPPAPAWGQSPAAPYPPDAPTLPGSYPDTN